MTQEFKRYEKYLVIKSEDIEKYLPEEEQRKLSFLTETIAIGRESEGKKDNSYVVVNEDELYAEVVWKLIEVSQTKPELLPLVLESIRGELESVIK